MKEFVLSTLSSSGPCNYLSFSCASARHTHTQIPSRLPSVSLRQVFQGPAVCTKTYLFPSRMQGVMSGEVEPAPYLMEREILKVTTLLVSPRFGSCWGSGGFLAWKSMFFAVKMLEPNRKTDGLLNLPSHVSSHSRVLSKASLKGSSAHTHKSSCICRRG